MRMSVVFLSIFILAIAACSKPIPLSGRYKSQVGALEFETSTELNIFIVGSSRWSGMFYAAKYDQSGSDLTVNTKPNGSGNYTNTYYFKVIDDGAVLRLVKMKSLDRETQKTAAQDAPDTDSNNFSKVLLE